MTALFMGGISSGKSAAALEAAEQDERNHSRKRWTIVVTADPSLADPAMKNQIRRHQQERDPNWQVLQAYDDLTSTVQEALSMSDVVVVDCLSLWLGRWCSRVDEWHQGERVRFVESVARWGPQAPLWFVSMDVGLGGVPMHPAGRVFAVELGRLNSDVAKLCAQVWLFVAGCGLAIKA